MSDHLTADGNQPETRPTIRFFTPFRAVLVAITVIAAIYGFATIPAGATLPTHWNVRGVADGWLPRDIALILPVLLIAATWGVVALTRRFASPEQLAAGRHVLSASISTVLMVFGALQVAVVLIGNGIAVDPVRVLCAVLALSFMVIGNALSKSRPNSYAGIRIPATLRSEANWRATHRLGGVLQIAGAVVMLGAAVFVPTAQLLFWILGCTIIPMLVAVLYAVQRDMRSR
ncbi:SdpI family protein [Devosia sp.]|uniref:SdpI family protein n=1 Tax=Devosia sp. TaxID=1871048 RepID=UPI003A90E918